MDISDFKHKTKINVRFSDLDAMQHVNNATYLTYLEEARIEYFNTLFNKKRDNLDYEVIVGRIEINYIYPVVLGDEVVVFTRVTKIGNKSIEVENIVTIKKGSEYIKAATSITKLVYYDYKAKETRVVPDQVKSILTHFEKLKF